MRILGFSELWPKLAAQEFTTFRFPRRDRDWGVGEQVQVVVKPRTTGRCPLGEAQIMAVGRRWVVHPSEHYMLADMIRLTPDLDDIKFVTDEEAVCDGFMDRVTMLRWMWERYGTKVYKGPMNMLTVKWLSRLINDSEQPVFMREQWGKMVIEGMEQAIALDHAPEKERDACPVG